MSVIFEVRLDTTTGHWLLWRDGEVVTDMAHQIYDHAAEHASKMIRTLGTGTLVLYDAAGNVRSTEEYIDGELHVSTHTIEGMSVNDARQRLKEIAKAFANAPEGCDESVESIRTSIASRVQAMIERLSMMESHMVPSNILVREEYSHILEAVLNAGHNKYTYRSVIEGDKTTQETLGRILGQADAWIDNLYRQFSERPTPTPVPRDTDGDLGKMAQMVSEVLVLQEEFEREIVKHEDSGDPCAETHRRCFQTVVQELTRFLDYPLEDVEVAITLLRGQVLHLIHLIEDVPVENAAIQVAVINIREEFFSDPL